MLRVQMIGVALVAVFAMSAVAATGASAHEWLLGGKPITAAKTIMSKGTLELTDDAATGGAVAVSCAGFDTGTVGPGAADLISKVTAEELGTNNSITCTFVKKGACEGTTAKAVALALPWKTEIYSEGTETRDMITSDGAGSPGWGVTCKTLLGSMEDKCTVALGSTALANVTGGVDATFEKKSQKASCSLGNSTSGLVSGADFLESPAGETLTFF